MKYPIISVCIPSYNRTDQLLALLKSIDCDPEIIEIIICEDFSPKRKEIRHIVESFAASNRYVLKYFENPENLGFDGNLRRLVENANGLYVMFMGDDDVFLPGALQQFVNFLIVNSGVHYILRTYLTLHADGRVEYFRYLPKTKVLSAGETTVAWLFKRSVSLSGFTILTDIAKQHATDKLDGTLLYQVYLMAQTCIEHESIYCDIPIVRVEQSYRCANSMFGNAVTEKKRFIPGLITHDNSINFTKSFIALTEYLDQIHGTNLTHLVLNDISKYSYPFLSIQRKNGILPFLRYAKRLNYETGLGCTPYFHIYKWGLVLFNERLCDRFIGFVKRTLGYTPNF
jgi:abequosyltransferase